MAFEIHRDRERGHVQHGWLTSAHSFSFARYVNRDRQNFGALLVLNEDTIQPGQGFDEHFHDNMEIITIPLSGALQHGDSLCNESVIRAGDVQIMSAGTGIMHSEKNASQTEPVHLLQIWVVPDKQGLATRYEQKTVGDVFTDGRFQAIVSPFGSEGVVNIHQQAWFQAGRFEKEVAFHLTQHNAHHGTFLFVVEGSIKIKDHDLVRGDALAVWDEVDLQGMASASCRLLAIEVPMRF